MNALSRQTPARTTAGSKQPAGGLAQTRALQTLADARQAHGETASDDNTYLQSFQGVPTSRRAAPAGLAHSTLPDRRVRGAQHARPCLSSPWRP
jgi:hypothetical protein